MVVVRKTGASESCYVLSWDVQGQGEFPEPCEHFGAANRCVPRVNQALQTYSTKTRNTRKKRLQMNFWSASLPLSDLVRILFLCRECLEAETGSERNSRRSLSPRLTIFVTGRVKRR